MSHPLAQPLAAVWTALRWLPLAAAVGVLAGGSCAAFLSALDWATGWREQHPWIIALLPLAGLVIGLSYHWFGGPVEAGSELVLAEIEQPRRVLPLRMAPMILVGTVATHLFGGSAGREGTALQMGASLADQLSRPFGLDQRARRILLIAGVAGGFGAVFGTPIAGAVFALEVFALGAMRATALFPCLIAALIGDRVALALGVRHTGYEVGAVPALTLLGILAAGGAGAIFGLTALTFSALTRAIRVFAKRTIAWMPGRLVIGGILVALAVLALGTTRHIGLGIPAIVESFAGAAPPSDALLKIVLTALTLGFGFKGGEVTPLFFIGATLGSALSGLLPLPVGVLAAMGLVAVFAGATNAPIACVILAIELFGSGIGFYTAIACTVSYRCNGPIGIYRRSPRSEAQCDPEQLVGDAVVPCSRPSD